MRNEVTVAGWEEEGQKFQKNTRSDIKIQNMGNIESIESIGNIESIGSITTLQVWNNL